ncbi:MAG: hypothetical protein AAF288_09620 [Planctomycetota bacterium]
MTFRAVAAVVGVLAIAAGLLGMRQHRLELMHEAARLHDQMDRDRQRLWELETHIAEAADVARLQSVLDGGEAQWKPQTIESSAQRGAVQAGPLASGDVGPNRSAGSVGAVRTRGTTR